MVKIAWGVVGGVLDLQCPKNTGQLNAGSQLYEPEGSTQVHKWLAHGFQARTLSSDIFRISVLFPGFWAASAIISA